MENLFMGAVAASVAAWLWWNNYHTIDVKPPDDFYIWQEGDDENEAMNWQKRRDYEDVHKWDAGWVIVPGIMVVFVLWVVLSA